MANPRDYASDQEVRWCPGCGDYSVLKQFHTVLAHLELPRHKTVVVSGIGCSSRLPYYVNTFGVHSIHGRATAFVTGLVLARPDLDVWIVTGDGDALSIGGNHLIHLLRRNVKAPILLFNNEIYGLTKGQVSPTSPEGQVSKSSPDGALGSPFMPPALALGAGASFVARAMDRDPEHLRLMMIRAHEHSGSAFLEIYQNCNVFNDGAFHLFTEKESRAHHSVYLTHGQPLLFGIENSMGIRLDGFTPRTVNLSDGYSHDDLWIHDEKDPIKAHLLARMHQEIRPFGVLYAENRPSFQSLAQNLSSDKKAESIEQLLQGPRTWIQSE